MTSDWGRVPVFEEAWGEEFIATIRDYITGLEMSLETGDEDYVEVETISGQPFCGCSDCYERETYLMALKLALEGQEAGHVRLEPSQ